MSAPKAISEALDVDRSAITHMQGRQFVVEGIDAAGDQPEDYDVQVDGEDYVVRVLHDRVEDGAAVTVLASYY